jgi:hypothetical protein
VQLPEGEDLNEWLAVHGVYLFLMCFAIKMYDTTNTILQLWIFLII